jgi:hypothetical protein
MKSFSSQSTFQNATSINIVRNLQLYDESLSKCDHSMNLERILDILSQLMELEIKDPEQLQSIPTLTKRVGKLRNHPDKRISTAANQLVGEWKKILGISDKDKAKKVDHSGNERLTSYENNIGVVSEVAGFKPPLKRYNQTFTITIGDQAENHVGMQKIGSLAEMDFFTVIYWEQKSGFKV